MPHSKQATPTHEPFILWWMPVVALLAPLIYAAWRAASADAQMLENGLEALAWPGIALYAVTLIVLWAGWKIELE